MSFSTLNIGASSLYAAQRAAEAAAHNIANAGVEGYTKQRLGVTTAQPTPGTSGVRGDGMRGTGVAVVSIDRLRDVLSDLSFRAESGTAAATKTRTELLGRAEGVLGTYPAGAPAALDRFFAAWDQLSLTPTDPSARAHVLDSGRQLAGSLNFAAEQLQRLSDDAGKQIQAQVSEVNDLAVHVAKLNQSIADAVTAGQSPNDLLDQRDRTIDRLSALTGATVRPGDMLQTDVYVGNNVLVSGVTTRPLTATATGTPDGIRYGVAFADGPANAGGSLGAAARAVSLEIPGFVQQLDDLASLIASRVNTAHQGGHSLNSTGTPDGGDFFTGVRARDIAVRSTLDEDGLAASAGGARNDGNNALVMAGLRVGNPSIGDQLRGVNSRLGAAAANADREAKAAASALSGATAMRASANGVNLDEEMVDLVKFQHAYEAAARVISIADGFFDVIINRMGAGR